MDNHSTQNTMDERIVAFKESADYILQHITKKPTVGIGLGSGLGKLANTIQNAVTIPYHSIPNFKASTAIGHKGNLIIGTLAGKTVIAMQGRFHYYEGYTMYDVTFPIRVMAVLGVNTLLVSNAAGGVNPNFRVGDLMIIKDHINLMPNPLIGKNIEEMGPRFPDMTRVYDFNIRQSAYSAGKNLNIQLKEGVYVASTGPTYETPAEYRYFTTIGGDAVGMSTVPEVIVARHCGMAVFGMSVITNEAHTITENMINDGNDVIVAADKAADKMATLFTEIIRNL